MNKWEPGEIIVLSDTAYEKIFVEVLEKYSGGVVKCKFTHNEKMFDETHSCEIINTTANIYRLKIRDPFKVSLDNTNNYCYTGEILPKDYKPLYIKWKNFVRKNDCVLKGVFRCFEKFVNWHNGSEAYKHLGKEANILPLYKDIYSEDTTVIVPRLYMKSFKKMFTEEPFRGYTIIKSRPGYYVTSVRVDVPYTDIVICNNHFCRNPKEAHEFYMKERYIGCKMVLDSLINLFPYLQEEHDKIEKRLDEWYETDQFTK